jgi:hypothetical protein
MCSPPIVALGARPHGWQELTDRRVILQDNSFVGKKTALTSVPY